MTDPRTFYTETVPAQWNASLEAQQRLGEAGKAVYEAMRAVDATIRVEVGGDGGGSFFLNIEAGHMTPGARAAQPPFLTLAQDRADFERLASEAGDSALALLGGLSGLAGEMRLTRSRVEKLTAVSGSIRLRVEGERGFALRTHFGAGPLPEQPDASIRVDADVYRELRAGNIDPAQAFMDGRIQLEGDVGLTMQLALAAIGPD